VIAHLRTLCLQAAIFSLLTPVLWWLLPCPQNHAANVVVMIAACCTAASWLSVALACIVIAAEEIGVNVSAWCRARVWDIIEFCTAPGDYFRRKQLEDFTRVMQEIRADGHRLDGVNRDRPDIGPGVL